MRSIQSIIFIRLFMIIIIFFAVVSGVAFYLTKETMKQFVVSDAATSLSFIINNVKTNYESDLMALDQLAAMDGFLPFDEKKARPLIKDFLEFPNIFSTVHMYRADGKLVFAERRATMGPYHLKPDFHMKEPEYIALADRVIAEKHSLASQVFYSKRGTLFQTYITPVFADDKKASVFGILSGGVFPRLQRIDHLLKGLKLSQDNFILITDSNGHFISSDGISETEALRYLQKQTVQAAEQFFAHPDGDLSRPLLDEEVEVGKLSFIVMSLPISELKLVVSLGINRHRIEGKTRELSYRLFVALAAGLLLSLFASILIGDRLAKPFRRIAEAVNQVNDGKFSARVDYTADDEIGGLAKSINVLAEKIQKSEYLGNLWSIEEEALTAAGDLEESDLHHELEHELEHELDIAADLDLHGERAEPGLPGDLQKALDLDLDLDKEAGVEADSV